MNLINKFCILIVKAYQKILSPFIVNSCRFTPTCSNYTIEAFKKYNFLKALFLTFKRLLKCHPFNKGGHDPIP